MYSFPLFYTSNFSHERNRGKLYIPLHAYIEVDPAIIRKPKKSALPTLQWCGGIVVS